jgi:hypothetical protein
MQGQEHLQAQVHPQVRVAPRGRRDRMSVSWIMATGRCQNPLRGTTAALSEVSRIDAVQAEADREMEIAPQAARSTFQLKREVGEAIPRTSP